AGWSWAHLLGFGLEPGAREVHEGVLELLTRLPATERARVGRQEERPVLAGAVLEALRDSDQHLDLVATEDIDHAAPRGAGGVLGGDHSKRVGDRLVGFGHGLLRGGREAPRVCFSPG